MLLSSTAFLSGGLEEELHIPVTDSDEDDSDEEEFDSEASPVLGPNPYNNIMSMYSAVSEVYTSSPDTLAAINGQLMTYLGRMLRTAREELGSQESYLGEYVDLHAETETRRVGARKKSATEPKRGPKRKSRKVERTFEDSLID